MKREYSVYLSTVYCPPKNRPFSEKKSPSTRLPSEMKEAIGKSMSSEEDIVSTCLLYVENPASTRLPSTDPKKLFQLSEKDGYHDSPTPIRGLGVGWKDLFEFRLGVAKSEKRIIKVKL